jgi:hypothetical protein
VGIAGTGGGFGTAAVGVAVPNDPLLVGFVAYVQWTHLDAASPDSVPLVFSSGGILVVH